MHSVDSHSTKLLDAGSFRKRGERAVLYLSVCLLVFIFFIVLKDHYLLFFAIIGISVAIVKIQQAQFIGQCVEVTADSYPDVYNAAKIASERLTMDMPDLFVKFDPYINASAIGFFGKKSVVINSATINSMGPDELVSILGHEFAHIKCFHTNWMVITSPKNIISVPIVSHIMQYVFLLWSRKAEYTADRGGLISSRSFKASKSALVKIAVGKEVWEKIDVDSWLNEARNKMNLWVKIAQLFKSHPYIVYRVDSLEQFNRSLDGDTEPPPPDLVIELIEFLELWIKRILNQGKSLDELIEQIKKTEVYRKVVQVLVDAAGDGNDKIVSLILKKLKSITLGNNEKNAALLEAVVNGKTSTVKILLEEGADTNIKYSDGESLLTKAAKNGHLEIVNLLVKNGAYTTVVFVKAAGDGDLDLVRILVDYQNDIDAIDKKQTNALMSAVSKRHTEIVKLLIQKGADACAVIQDSASNEDFDSLKFLNENCSELPKALLKSAEYGLYKAVDSLLKCGVNIDTKDNKGCTPIFKASEHNYIETVKLLLSNGADVNLSDNSGITALMTAVTGNQFETVRLILENGADIYQKDRQSKTALTFALKNKDSDMIKLLAQHGADLTAALMTAAMKENIEKAKLLVDCNADLNVVLKETLSKGHAGAFETLLELGLPIDYADESGRPLLSVAIDTGQKEIIENLLNRGASPYPELKLALSNKDISRFKNLIEAGANANKLFFNSINEGNRENIEFLLNAGVDINNRDCEDNTALMITIKKGNTKLAKLLIEKGVYPDEKEKNKLLMYAAGYGDIELIDILLELGSDINIALTEAADIRDYQAFGFLVENGADTQKALFTLVSNGNVGAVKFLLIKGIEADKKNKNKQTALGIATAQSNPEMTNLLISYGANVENVVLDALSRDNFGTVNFLIENGAKVDDLLFNLAKAEELEKVKSLIEYGYDSSRALFRSVIEGDFTAEKTLKEAGARYIPKKATLT